MVLCRSRRFIVCATLAEYAIENLESLVDFACCDGERRREPDDVLPSRENEEAALERPVIPDFASTTTPVGSISEAIGASAAPAVAAETRIERPGRLARERIRAERVQLERGMREHAIERLLTGVP